MGIPRFTAELSLSPTVGTYRGGRVCAPKRGEVSMQLDNPRFNRPKFPRLKNWDRLFASPGPLEETCDTGAADCSKGCTSRLNAAKAECAKVVDETQRQSCFNEVVASASACQTNCSNSFPSTEACPPLGGF